MLTSLSKLLLGLNPRSGRPDHMLNVTKFVYFGYWLPAAKLAAVKVIGFVAASPANQPALLATLMATAEISNLTLKAFTDALDCDDDEDEEEEGGGGEGIGRGPKLASREPGAARLAILELLQAGLNMASPSLAHFLLGFDLRRGVGRSELQSPAVVGIRTPFHAIVGLLTTAEPGMPAAVIARAPQLATAMFQLIFLLVSNPETAEPVLRFLRSGGDFFASQLACVTAMLDRDGVQSLRGVAWLLRATAVELRVLARTRQASQVAKLLGLLLDAAACGDPLDGGSDGGGEGTAAGTSGLYSNTTFSQLSRTTAQPSRYHTSKLDSPLANHRLITILNCISFSVEQLPPASWELFDNAQVDAVLQQCEEVVCGASQQRLIVVPRLHRILAAELASLQGSTGINQRALVQSEIQSILHYAVRWNAIQEGAVARRDLLDAWRQVTEVLLVTAPADQLPPASKQQILLQLLQTLLNKVVGSSEEETAPGLAHLVSSAVLLLLNALRETYDSVPDRTTVLGDTFVGLLDSTVAATAQQSPQQGAFSAALHVILKGLVAWVMSVGTGHQVIRTNIYSALLAYLKIGKPVSTALSRLHHNAASMELSEAGKLHKINLEVILGQGGPAFLEILARDASSGHEVRRMLALAVLDELVVLDHRAGACTRFLADQGFLKHLIESLLVDEAGLINLITQQPNGNIRDLFVFEAKLGLLSRIAARPLGAEMLLQAGLMARLAEFSVLDLRPDPDSALLLQKKLDHMGEDGVGGGGGGALGRYHSILFPVLRLCQAVLSSLGGENRSAAAQTLHFLTGHEEVLALVLRASTARASLHPALLQELALVTGVVSRAATLDIRSEALDAAGFELSGQLARIQRQMLGLLQLFQLSDSLVSTLEDEDDNAAAVMSTKATQPRSLLVMQVTRFPSSFFIKLCFSHLIFHLNS